MKRLFISQPMRNKTDEEIIAEREEAVKVAKKMLNEDVEVIDSFFQEAPHGANPLWYLAKSLELLATADVAFFCTDWEKYRGCRIEHTCANEYGIQIIRNMTLEPFEERSITLTNREWDDVETYLMFTEGFFAQMIEVWEKFAQKKDSDGNLENPVAVNEVGLLRNANQSAWKLLSEI